MDASTNCPMFSVIKLLILAKSLICLHPEKSRPGLLDESKRKKIVARFLYDIDYAYPIPTLNRDQAVKSIQSELEKGGVYSRGRFGAWKYEVGNTDHSVMQGKEVVDRILKKGSECVWSL